MSAPPIERGDADRAPERDGGDRDRSARSERPRSRVRTRTRRSTVFATVAVAAWAVTIAGARAWAFALERDGHHLILFTPPILGGDRVTGLGRFWIPVLVGGALVAALPAVTHRWRWRPTLLLGTAAALTWWIALAAVDGWAGLVDGLHWDADFGGSTIPATADAVAYLRGFVASLPHESIQVRAHPPGLPLLLGALERAGLGGPGWAAVVVLVVGASGVAAVLVALRTLVDEDTARRALPFLALAPAATWMATSFDALYAGVGAWVIALLALAASAITAGRVARATAWAAGAGALAFATAMLSYGLVLLGFGAVIVAMMTRRLRPLLVATATAVGLAGITALAGFWWLDGLDGTRAEYYGLGLDRPYRFFLVNNVAAWFLALGPATVAGLARVRDRRLAAVIAIGVIAAVAADLSGLSNGEVERIWLPFTLWVLPAGAALAHSRPATRAWLGVQVVAAIGLAAVIAPYW